MSYITRAWVLGICLVVGAGAYDNVAAAAIEEVVVVAQKREQNVQDVPISISVFSGADLERRGLNDLQQLANFVPNLDLPASNNMRNSQVRIRGIGSSGTNPGIESSVGVFLDGLYMPTSAMSLGELADINNVEVLRGPQGTLYGRNTPVGAINITTRRPVQELETLLRVGGGDFDHRWLNGYVGGGLGDNAAGRLSFYYRERDGYEDNEFLGGSVNDNEEQGLRGRLLFAPTDALEVNIAGYYSTIERRCCVAEQIDPSGPFGIATQGFLDASAALGYPFQNFDDDDRDVHADDEGDDQIDSWGSSLQIDWTLANDHVLTAITGYQDWDNQVLIAADSLPQPVIQSNQQQVNEVLSQEFRLTSPSGNQVEYIAGVFFYGQDTTFQTGSFVGEGANRVFPFPPALCAAPCRVTPGQTGFQDFDQETRSVAAFGSATWYLSEKLDVTGGLRWSQDKKDATINHFNSPDATVPFTRVFRENLIGDLDRTDKNVTWSVNSRYQLSESVMAFASVATGFKSGGFNATRVPPGTPVEFEDEQSISYDVGIKSNWLDRRLQVNATAYWTVLEDFQESSLNLEAGTGFIVTNAGERRARGLEADLIAAPTEGLTLTAALAYLDAEYTEFPNAQCGAGETPDGPAGTCDRKGDTPAFAPEWKYSVGAELVRPIGGTALEWRARADYAWVDDQNLIRVTIDEPGNQKSYGLLNLRAGIGAANGAWSLSAFVNNALDEDYFIQAAGQPGAGLISSGGFAGASGFVGWYGPPRTMGVQLTWRHGGY